VGAPQRFSPLEYRDPTPWPWLIHALGVVNRFAILGGLLKIRRVDLPAADRRRLGAAVNRDTAAFLGPNHPEFLTDWMVDKEVSRLCSPLMAHWASYEIVNASPAARAFWLSQNLIANVPGGGGRAYSLRWAERGHGVLPHPEGTATWHGERIGTLLPGIVEMAWDLSWALRSRSDARPVCTVPIAWRLAFRGDVRQELTAEIGRIEQALALPRSRGALDVRFAALLRGLLAQQCGKLALPAPDGSYFAAQARTIAALRALLAGRYGPLDPDFTRANFQLRKAMRERAAGDPDGVRTDRARLVELQRLTEFDPALYGGSRLAQERIAEVLKRTRSSLVTRGLRNSLHNGLPIAAGPRTAHVRVPEAIAVRATAPAPDAGKAERQALLAEHGARLQRTLDDLGTALDPRRNASRLRTGSRNHGFRRPPARGPDPARAAHAAPVPRRYPGCHRAVPRSAFPRHPEPPAGGPCP